MTDLPTIATTEGLPTPLLAIDQPRTSLLPPAPGRHHWCIVIPPSTLPRFDGPGADAALHVELVEQLWERGLGCARFDLFPPSREVAPGHPAAFGRQLTRATDVLERVRRIDPQAQATVLASGDGVDIALALNQIAHNQSWPVLRSLLLLPPTSDDTPEGLTRQAAELARGVAHDERPVAPVSRPGVTRQLLRRLAR